MPIRASRDPRTKEEVLNKLLAFDFSGNIRTLGENTIVERRAPNVVRITFPRTGKFYDLTVHKPRPEDSQPRAKRQPPVKEAAKRGRQRRTTQ